MFFLDEPKAVNLHQVWDYLILLNREATMAIAEYATTSPDAKITPEQAAEWAKGTPTDWANESHAAASQKRLRRLSRWMAHFAEDRSKNTSTRMGR